MYSRIEKKVHLNGQHDTDESGSQLLEGTMGSNLETKGKEKRTVDFRKITTITR